jgi:hypothetical protein
MKNRQILLLTCFLLVISGSFLLAITMYTPPDPDGGDGIVITTDSTEEHMHHGHDKNGCVFKTVFEGEFNFDSLKYETPEQVRASLDKALGWLIKSQHKDGGWGAGSHYQQDIKDPFAVPSDPATTAMVSMSLLRCEMTPTSGIYSAELNKAIVFLLGSVEGSDPESLTITELQNTQPQIKLGQNIDVVLTSQFLTNLLDHIHNDPSFEKRIKDAIQTCVNKIELAQQANGSFAGGSWAGVLQSSFATAALESAESRGIAVDSIVLESARDYQSGNYDTGSGAVKTDEAAGVMLYSISSTSRNTAQGATKAKSEWKKAKEDGRIDKDAELNAENLQKAGLSEAEAMKLASAYEINEASKSQAMSGDVMVGFGNNGGEEFLSFLQTGEGLIVGNDQTWKKWYDNVSVTLLNIQEKDGNWSGHHCITSPVFCTATAVLILSINNDVEELALIGHK